MLKKTFLGVLFAVFVSFILIAGINFNVTNAEDYGSSGTSVGGIIWENTTWTLENSPYIIAETVQIPEYVMLTIEPGVSVISSTAEGMFLLQGEICAEGNIDDRIVFDGGGDSIIFFDQAISTRNTFLSLDYCTIKNGKFCAFTGGGSLSLRHCQLINLTFFSGVHHNEREAYIEYNFFTNSGGLSFRTCSNVYIRYNLFNGTVYPPGYDKFCISNYANYWGSEAIIEYNSFINIDGVVLRSGPYATNISAVNNYWGTTSIDDINSMIYDRNDDITCTGFIQYSPVLSEPHPNTTVWDVTPPSTVNDYDGGWHNKNFTIHLKANDDLFGVSETFYKINDKSILNVSAHGQPLITTESDNNTLEYWSADNVGNEELPHNILTGIKLDKTAPTIEILSHIPKSNVQPDQEVKVLVNVTDFVNTVKNVTLSYNLNDSAIWTDLPMILNSTTGLYEVIIPGQQINTLVKYKIAAYDNAGNHKIEDNSGQYYVYTVIPEFPSLLILPLFMIATLLAVIVYRRKHPV